MLLSEGARKTLMEMEGKPPTFKKVILWQAKTELRTATPRHFCQLLIAIQ